MDRRRVRAFSMLICPSLMGSGRSIMFPSCCNGLFVVTSRAWIAHDASPWSGVSTRDPTVNRMAAMPSKAKMANMVMNFFIYILFKGRKDKRTKGRKDERTKRQKDKRTKGRKDERTKRQKDKRTKRQKVEMSKCQKVKKSKSPGFTRLQPVITGVPHFVRGDEP